MPKCTLRKTTFLLPDSNFREQHLFCEKWEKLNDFVNMPPSWPLFAIFPFIPKNININQNFIILSALVTDTG